MLLPLWLHRLANAPQVLPLASHEGAKVGLQGMTCTHFLQFHSLLPNGKHQVPPPEPRQPQLALSFEMPHKQRSGDREKHTQQRTLQHCDIAHLYEEPSAAGWPVCKR